MNEPTDSTEEFCQTTTHKLSDIPHFKLMPALKGRPLCVNYSFNYFKFLTLETACDKIILTNIHLVAVRERLSDGVCPVVMKFPYFSAHLKDFLSMLA